MNNPLNRRIAIVILVALVVIAAIAVRLRSEAQYGKARKDYAAYQQRLAVQQQAISEAGANEQKIAQLRAAIAKNPKDVPARWALAGELQKFRLLKEALPELMEITKLDPKSPDAVIAVANTELALGRLNAAEQSYRRITQTSPKNIEGWQGLAATLYQLRRFRDAGSTGRQALVLDPKDRGSQIIVASSALEFAMENPNEDEIRAPLQIARALYTMLAKEDPENGQNQYQLGLSIFLLHDKKGCLPHLQKAVELLPDRANVAADYGQILISNGKYAEARTFLKQAIARKPKIPAFYYLLAESYQYESDPHSLQEAIQNGKKAVELAPNNTSYWDRLGSACLKALNFEEARVAFEKSLLLNQNRSYPYQQLAGIYTRMGDPKRASVAAKMATRMTANDETMRHLESLSAQYPGAVNLILVRADRYRDLKMWGPARDLYDQALKLDPKSVAAQRAIDAIDKAQMPTAERK